VDALRQGIWKSSYFFDETPVIYGPELIDHDITGLLDLGRSFGKMNA
jgi:hypothetical protein